MLINPPVLDDYFRLKIIQQLSPQSLCLQVHNLLHGEPAEDEAADRSHIYHMLIMCECVYNHLYGKQRSPSNTHLYLGNWQITAPAGMPLVS